MPRKKKPKKPKKPPDLSVSVSEVVKPREQLG